MAPPGRHLDPDTDVIRGGCPDGFWVRYNCDMAAHFGLCTMTTIEDHRPADLVTPAPAHPPAGPHHR